MKIIVQNKKARLKYQIFDRLEAGIVLKGYEIKSLRLKQVDLSDSFAKILQNELWLINCHIAPYQKQAQNDFDPKRSRKLLVKKNELSNLQGKLRKGFTLIPLKIYLKKGLAKVEIVIARGLKKYQKKQALKEKDLKRQADRELKSY